MFFIFTAFLLQSFSSQSGITLNNAYNLSQANENVDLIGQNIQEFQIPSGIMNVYLHQSNICRLCAENNPNGVLLFDNSEPDSDLSSLINQYLPFKVRTFEVCIANWVHNLTSLTAYSKWSLHWPSLQLYYVNYPTQFLVFNISYLQ